MDRVTTIGIVDDHPLVCVGLEAACKANPTLDVVYAGASVSSALSCSPDVVLLDVRLNGTDVSIEEVEQLMAAGSKVIIVSAYAEPTIVRALVSAGVVGYVMKHDRTDSLLQAIEAAINGDTWTTLELAAVLMRSDSTVELSDKEREALRLYASGLKIESVAEAMGVAPSTVREYIKRVRSKFRAVGRPVSTKIDLHKYAIKDGLLRP